jgi:hypothetical protein
VSTILGSPASRRVAPVAAIAFGAFQPAHVSVWIAPQEAKQ